MDRAELLDRLSRDRSSYDRMGVDTLAVFGSAARDQLGLSSDVDLLVRFRGPANFDRYMNLKFFLEELLGRRIDLVTHAALRPELRASIERDAIRVA